MSKDRETARQSAETAAQEKLSDLVLGLRKQLFVEPILVAKGEFDLGGDAKLVYHQEKKGFLWTSCMDFKEGEAMVSADFGVKEDLNGRLMPFAKRDVLLGENATTTDSSDAARLIKADLSKFLAKPVAESKSEPGKIVVFDPEGSPDTVGQSHTLDEMLPDYEKSRIERKQREADEKRNLNEKYANLKHEVDQRRTLIPIFNPDSNIRHGEFILTNDDDVISNGGSERHPDFWSIAIFHRDNITKSVESYEIGYDSIIRTNISNVHFDGPFAQYHCTELGTGKDKAKLNGREALGVIDDYLAKVFSQNPRG